MSLTGLRGLVFRITSPRYRDLRRTAEMSRIHLGRFNTASIGAVYASAEPATAVEELRRRAARDGTSLAAMHPRSIFALSVDLHAIVDLPRRTHLSHEGSARATWRVTTSRGVSRLRLWLPSAVPRRCDGPRRRAKGRALRSTSSNSCLGRQWISNRNSLCLAKCSVRWMRALTSRSSYRSCKTCGDDTTDMTPFVASVFLVSCSHLGGVIGGDVQGTGRDEGVRWLSSTETSKFGSLHWPGP